MKNLIFLFLVFIASSCCQQINESADLLQTLSNGHWIDLTHSFDEESVYWPTNIPFTHDTVFYGITDNGYFYSSFKFAAEEHGGTHFDAAIHFGESKNTVDQVPVTQLNGVGVVIDVSEKALKNRDYLISTEDFLAWEEDFGKIPENAIVLLNTGYGQFYSDKERYTGTTKTGPEAIPDLHFPGLHPEAAKWLTSERKINGIGLDTPSIDYGQSSEFMAHRILCANNMTVYENVANLDQLPAKGSYIIALPMKIKGGSGAPLRIIAFIPE